MCLFPQCHIIYFLCLFCVYFLNQKDVFILILMARFIYILQYHKINQGIALMRCQRTCVHEFVWIDHNNHLDFSLWLRFDWPNVYVVFNFYYLKREQITAYNLFILKKYFYVRVIQDCESFVPIAKLFCVNIKSVLKILKTLIFVS